MRSRHTLQPAAPAWRLAVVLVIAIATTLGSAAAHAALTPPATPGSLGGDETSLSGTYTLTWGASPGTGVTYSLNEKVGNSTWTVAPLQAATSFNITNAPDNTYQYRVKACNAAGCSATTAVKTVTVRRIPTTPAGLSVPAVSTSGTFALTWAAAQQTVDTYEVQRRAQGGTFTNVGFSTSTSFMSTSHPDGVFDLRVRACNGSGCGAYSGAVTVNVLKTPLPPTGLLASGVEKNSGRYVVHWTASAQSTVTHYDFQWTKAGGSWTSLATMATQVQERKTEAATYAYRVRACNSLSCSGFSPTLSLQITPQFSNIVDDAAVVHLPVPAQEMIGTLDGSGGVQGGAAAYNINLTVPPGRQGLQPAISLQYGSRGGNGLLGVGWSLDTGSSSVYRCPQTIAQDGKTRAVDFTGEDRLCLDGQRLVLKAGSYGQNGSEYRTEIDGFARVTLNGNMSQSTSYFKVEHKSGLVSYLGSYEVLSPYGNVNGAYVPVGAAAPLAWKLRRVEDPQGNSIMYSYVGSNSEHLLSAIEYTGLNRAVGDRRVMFGYGTSRPDARLSYQAHGAIPMARLLTSVQTYVGSERVRWYQLSYHQSPATGRELLESVRDCLENECRNGLGLPPTTFVYNQEPIGFAETTIAAEPLNGPFVTAYSLDDFDGDGTRDLYYSERPRAQGSIATRTEIRLSSQPTPTDITNQPWLSGFDGVSDTFNGDLDQDGLADISGRVNGFLAIASPVGGTRKTSNLALPQGSSIPASRFADYDGDGDVDALVGEGQQLSWHNNCSVRAATTLTFCGSSLVTTLASTEKLVSIMDLDGNGLLDLYIDWRGIGPMASSRIVLTRRVGGVLQFESKTIASLGGPTPSLAATKGAGFFDANGDSLPDLYVLPGKFWINRGGTFTALPDQGDTLDVPSHLFGAVLVMDFDGDGADELMLPTELLGAFCFTYISAGPDEPIEVCGADFKNGNANPAHDRSIYRWDALRVRVPALGQVALTRQQTPLKAPVHASTVEDFFGDGLPDVRYRIAILYGANQWDDFAPLSRYVSTAGLTFGTNVARNLGSSSTGTASDELAHATDGFGHTVRWQYSALSTAGSSSCGSSAQRPFYRTDRATAEPDAFHFTSSMRVVSRFTSDSGADGERARCYRYEDAMYSLSGRGFLGFRKIHSEDATTFEPEDNLRTTTAFHAAFPLTGRVASVRLELASDTPGSGTPIQSVQSSYESSCASGICLVNQTKQVEANYDLATRALKDMSTTQYTRTATDRSYGNVTTVERTVDDATATYVERVTTGYDYADVASWWLDKVHTETSVVEPAVVKVAPFPDGTLNTQKTVSQAYEWYPIGHASRRKLKKSSTQAGSTTQWSSTTLSYDSYGNATSATAAGAGVAATRTTNWQYGTDGYFPIVETNPLQHVTTFEHLATTGAVKRRDAYGVTIDMTYDAFGRLLDSIPEGAPPQRTRIVACDSTCSVYQGRARFRVVTVQDGAATRTTTFDRLGRPLEQRQTGFGGADIVQAILYDVRGRRFRVSEPAYDGGTNHFTEFANYDALGRLGRKTVDRWGQTPNKFETTYSYSGLDTTINLPAGLSAKRTFNALGSVVGTVDPTGGRTAQRYDGAGNLILLQDPAGNVTRMRYDQLGRRIEVVDPNRGTVQSSYNGLGETTSETTANADLVAFEYDQLGRQVRRRINGALDAEFLYDTQQPGLLDAEVGGSGFRRDYAYDSLWRPIKTTTSIDGLQFVMEQAYDGYYGRVKAVKYPSGEVLGKEFSPTGYLETEFDPLASGAAFVYRRVTSMTARQQLGEVQFGNGLVGTYDYFTSTGQVKTMRTGTSSSPQTMVQNLTYAYADPFMNLTTQLNVVKGVSETFKYDGLQRLEEVRRVRASGTETLTYGYDALGNIKRKGDFATNYGYGSAARSSANAGPNAVLSVTKLDGTVAADFDYDFAGNMVSGLGRSLSYNAFNLPTFIQSNGTRAGFHYAPDLQRYKQASDTRTTYYVQGVYEYVVEGGQVEEKSYLGADVLVRSTATTREVRYLHLDRLGSVDTVTDEAGVLVEAHGFDAFGKPLASDWKDTGGQLHSGEYSEQNTTRGFTGHEHLDDSGIIHMNGRVYDPELGRFLSADPLVQDIGSSQALNPYSYVLNNPLSGLDPTGYACKTADGEPCVEAVPVGDAVAALKDAAAASGKQGQGAVVARQQVPAETVTTAHQLDDAGHERVHLDATGDVQYFSSWNAEAGQWRFHDGTANSLQYDGLEPRIEVINIVCSPNKGSWLDVAKDVWAVASFFMPPIVDIAMTAWDAGKLAAEGKFSAALGVGLLGAAAIILPGNRKQVEAGVGVLFAQESVKKTFVNGEFAGQTIGTVAQGLRTGRISPDQLPLEIIRRDGLLLTLNNRSLAALRRAGMEPTILKDMTGIPEAEAQLVRQLRKWAPSDVIRIRTGDGGSPSLPNASSIE